MKYSYMEIRLKINHKARIKEIAEIEECEIVTMKVEIGMFVKLIGNEENSLISGYRIKEMEKIAQFKWISITNNKISATFFIKY